MTPVASVASVASSVASASGEVCSLVVVTVVSRPVWVVPGWFKLVRCVPALGRILKKETWIFFLTCDHDTVLVRSKSVAVA